MSVSRFIIVLCGGLMIVSVGRNIATEHWWRVVLDVFLIALLTYTYVRVEEKELREGHRTTAANCKFWTGDNGEVDWGTCIPCQEEVKADGRRAGST